MIIPYCAWTIDYFSFVRKLLNTVTVRETVDPESPYVIGIHPRWGILDFQVEELNGFWQEPDHHVGYTRPCIRQW